ncbi:MAG: hypothetical protein HY658_04650 [Actinobacteria bacterium]|nr:hypothetical protein [Actinomycetota bacterium]
MGETRPSGNGAGAGAGSEAWTPPRLPLWILLVGLAVAVGAVSVLIYVLYQRTTGPGEVVRAYYVALNEGDCDGSLDLLTRDLRSGLDHDEYCADMARFEGRLGGELSIDSVLLVGQAEDRARVITTYAGSHLTWELSREDGEWRILGFPDLSRLPAR